MQIRKLKARDFRLLAKMMRRLVADCNQKWIENIVKSDEGESGKDATGEDDSKFVRLFSDIITLLVDNYETDLTAWFADLCNLSPEDYLEENFNIDLVVVEQIAKDEKFKDFFSKAWAAARNNSLFGPILSSVKTRYDSMIASRTSSSESSTTESTGSGPTIS